MNKIYSLLKSLLLLAACIAMLFTAVPTSTAFASTATSTPTPAQLRFEARLKNKYGELKSDLGNLLPFYETAQTQRADFVNFIARVDREGFKTDKLTADLAFFDNLLTPGLNARQDGIFVLAATKGLDSSGNVIDASILSADITKAAQDDNIARGRLILAVFVLHSSLSNFRHVYPGYLLKIHKLRLAAFPI